MKTGRRYVIKCLHLIRRNLFGQIFLCLTPIWGHEVLEIAFSLRGVAFVKNSTWMRSAFCFASRLASLWIAMIWRRSTCSLLSAGWADACSLCSMLLPSSSPWFLLRRIAFWELTFTPFTEPAMRTLMFCFPSPWPTGQLRGMYNMFLWCYEIYVQV